MKQSNADREAFDAWVRKSLAAKYGDVLGEALPPEWFALVDRAPHY